MKEMCVRCRFYSVAWCTYHLTELVILTRGMTEPADAQQLTTSAASLVSSTKSVLPRPIATHLDAKGAKWHKHIGL